MSAFSMDVSAADFEQAVIEASKTVPVVVDFWAEWCGPCRALKPVLEKLAVEYAGKFRLAKINSDENQPLAQRYGVRGIPNVKAFVGGELVLSRDEHTGEAGVRPIVATVATKDQPIYEVVIEDALGNTETLHTTAEHPFWVVARARRWKLFPSLLRSSGLMSSVRSAIFSPGFSSGCIGWT